MTEREYNSKQRKQLKALAHHLKPMVQIGHKGMTNELIAEIIRNLDDHELIKIKMKTEDKELKNAWIAEISQRTDATFINLMGHIATFFRPSSNSDKQKIKIK